MIHNVLSWKSARYALRAQLQMQLLSLVTEQVQTAAHCQVRENGAIPTYREWKLSIPLPSYFRTGCY